MPQGKVLCSRLSQEKRNLNQANIYHIKCTFIDIPRSSTDPPLHKLSAFLRYICAERLHEYPATLNHIRQKLHMPKNLLRRHAFPGILSLSLSATYTKIAILSVCIARLPRFACYAREPNEPISIEISKRKQHQQQHEINSNKQIKLFWHDLMCNF